MATLTIRNVDLELKEALPRIAAGKDYPMPATPGGARRHRHCPRCRRLWQRAAPTLSSARAASDLAPCFP
jgi:hypothetical protein